MQLIIPNNCRHNNVILIHITLNYIISPNRASRLLLRRHPRHLVGDFILGAWFPGKLDSKALPPFECVDVIYDAS